MADEYPFNKEGYLSIMHADNQILAEELLSYFMVQLNIPQPLISFLPPAIIIHAGPGLIAVGIFQGTGILLDQNIRYLIHGII